MTTSTIDPASLHLLAHQGRRMRWALGQFPPDRKEAARIQVRVDDILDRRPALAGHSADGEPIWDNSSPNVLAQIDQPFVPIQPGLALNATGEPERMVDETRFLEAEPSAPDLPGNAGGVGLLERDPGENLSREAEDEIRRFGRRLGDQP